MECKQRVSDPERRPWVKAPCWFKTCTSGVVEKRLIYSIITYQHEEYDQDGNIAQNSKKTLSGHMPLSQSLKTDRANQQVFLASTSHPFLKNSGLVFRGSWGLQTLTLSSSNTSETKNPSHSSRTWSRETLNPSVEATSFPDSIMELPWHVSFTGLVKYTECGIGNQELNCL